MSYHALCPWLFPFLLGLVLATANDACGSLEPFRSSRAIPNDLASIKIQGPHGWLPAHINDLQLKFSPVIEAGADYTISRYPQQVPAKYQYGKEVLATLQLILEPGRYWAGQKLKKNHTAALYLVGISCGKKSNWKFFKSPIMVAVLVHRPVT